MPLWPRSGMVPHTCAYGCGCSGPPPERAACPKTYARVHSPLPVPGQNFLPDQDVVARVVRDTEHRRAILRNE
jgi:hypothetical protein